MTIRRLLTLGALGLALAGRPAVAEAQAPSTGFGLGAISIPGGKKGSPGPGLRFGHSVFHAGLTLEGGWDSNVFYAGDGPVSSAYLRLMPTLSLGTAQKGGKSQPSVVYQLDGLLDYIAYLQDIGPNGQRHHVGASVGANVQFNPRGKFRFTLLEQFVRTTEPRPGLQGGISRDFNQAGFDMRIIPGGGLVEILLSYRLVLDWFEDSTYDFARSLANQVSLKGSWRFFPKTSLWLRVTAGYYWYLEEFNAGNLGAVLGTAAAGNRDAVPISVMTGVTGRLTPKLTADVGIGYRGIFYTDKLPSVVPSNIADDDRHDVVATLGLNWAIAPSAKLGLGYQHDTQMTVIADSYTQDSLYLTLNLAFLQRLTVDLTFGWTLAAFEGYYVAGYDPATLPSGCRDMNVSSGAYLCPRKDNYLLGSVNASYHFLKWLAVGLGYQLMANISSFEGTFIASGVTSVQRPTFTKHRVFGLVSIQY